MNPPKPTGPSSGVGSELPRDTRFFGHPHYFHRHYGWNRFRSYY